MSEEVLNVVGVFCLVIERRSFPVSEGVEGYF